MFSDHSERDMVAVDRSFGYGRLARVGVPDLCAAGQTVAINNVEIEQGLRDGHMDDTARHHCFPVSGNIARSSVESQRRDESQRPSHHSILPPN